MNYLSHLNRVAHALSVLDSTSYDTIGEANGSQIKYDRLKDDVILILRRALDDLNGPVSDKECIYNNAIQILADHIGSADDIQKYGNVLQSFHNEGKITQQQLFSLYNKLDIGRWQ